MSRTTVTALLAILASITAHSVLAAAPVTEPADDWLMMVATRCTDAAREADFNKWYDDIDIPDVLEVPGYQRARRGLRLGTAASPVEALPEDEGRYVALYDITASSIDKTIIEMLMATRKMEARGRSTDLLKVTERVYYHRLGTPIDGAVHPSSGAATRPASSPGALNDYLYVERIDCCRNEADEQRFDDWYRRDHLLAVLKSAGFRRATRYELYRVLMIEPKEATRYLTVYELEAGSDQEAVARMSAARDALRAAGAQNNYFAENGSLMFRKLRDVHR